MSAAIYRHHICSRRGVNIAQIRMGQGTVLRWVFWVILLLQVGIFVTSMPQSASAATKRYPIGPQGELQITLQEEWKGVLKPSRPNLPLTIEISPGVGDAFLFLLTPLAASNKQSSDGADSRFLVERMSAPAVEQSVEKKADIRPINGEQNQGYYFSLTDAAPAPGEYKCMTQGLIKVGDFLMSFTILSNDATQNIRDAALGMLRSAQQIKAQAPEDLDIAIPGQGWKLHLLNPSMDPVHEQSGPSGFKFNSSNADGFRFTAFIEKPAGEGQRHEDVFEHYWKLARNNPLIEQNSIQVEKRENFVKVRYLTSLMPNVNYYFTYKGRWVDLHISKLPYGQKDEELFASFEKHLSYGE